MGPNDLNPIAIQIRPFASLFTKILLMLFIYLQWLAVIFVVTLTIKLAWNLW